MKASKLIMRIPATGVFNNPQLPDIKGMELFESEMMHSNAYRHPDQVKEKRVLVVGNGPSDTDISFAVGAVTEDGFAYLSIHTGVELHPVILMVCPIMPGCGSEDICPQHGENSL